MASTRQLYIERRLTNVSVAYKNGNFVADRVCPIVPVPDKSGKILEDDKTALQADAGGDDAIGQGEYPGTIKTDLQDRSYSTVERAKSAFLHDDDVAADEAQGQPYRPRIRKTNAVTQRMLINREVRVATLYRATATWAAGHNSTPATKWDAASGSDPVADITAAKLKVKTDLMLPPNVAVVPWEVMIYLANNSAVKSLTSGGATFQNPAVDQSMASMIALMQRIFGIEDIQIPSAANFGGNMKATFLGGAPAAAGGVWGDDVWIGYVPSSPDRDIPSAGYTYAWENAFEGAARNAKGLVVTEERDDRARGQYITARAYWNELALIPEAGYVLTNTLNAF